MVDCVYEVFKIYCKVFLVECKVIMIKVLDILCELEVVLVNELIFQMGCFIFVLFLELQMMCKCVEYYFEIVEEVLFYFFGKFEDGFERWVSRELVGFVFIFFVWNVCFFYLYLVYFFFIYVVD